MTIPLRAALYLRVSTARQAEHDVSIPDQKRQGEAYCEARNLQLVETFIEPGASATNDRRPEFQRMIEAGTSKPAPFDVVVVHSFSRFFRDHFELVLLAKSREKYLGISYRERKLAEFLSFADDRDRGSARDRGAIDVVACIDVAARQVCAALAGDEAGAGAREIWGDGVRNPIEVKIGAAFDEIAGVTKAIFIGVGLVWIG